MRRLVLLFLFAALPLQAASQYPPSYRWRTITTDHFYIHFHQGEEDLARRAARIAEDVHDRVTPIMGWEPEDRTHVILSDNIDISNGSATFFPNNRIEIFVSAPGADPSSPLEHYDNWLNLVMTHEYVHILHLDQAFDVTASIRKIFGRNPLVFPNAYSPLWMIEGIATLVESEATDAGRLKGTFVEMVLRTAAIENQWLSEPQASGFSPAWPGGSARYFYGSKFLQFVAQRHGVDSLRQFFNEYASVPIPYRIEPVAAGVFGETFGEMYQAWSHDARGKYAEERRVLEREGLTRRERVTRLGHETKYSVISPDGRRLAYAHRGAFETPTIRVLDIATMREIDSHRVNTISHLGWSPDGRSLAYSQLEFKDTFSLISDLYVWNVGSFRERQITSGKRLKDPSFSAGGRSLVAVENRAGRNRIVEVDIASGSIRPLVEPNDFTQFSEPVVSDDGQSIAVAEWRNGRIDIVVYDREGKRRRNLTESLPAATHASPRFAADGRRIYFSSDLTGISNIYVVDLDGGEARRLTNVYGGAFFPSTHDGKTIYFTDYSSQGFDIARFKAGDPYETRHREKLKSVVGRKDEIRDISPRADRQIDLDDRPYRAADSLAPRWWFPVLFSTQDESVFGAQTSGGDVLGFHQYQAQLVAAFGVDQDRFDYGLVYSYDRLYPTLTAAIVQYDESFSDVTIRRRNGQRWAYQETTQRVVGLASFPYQRFRWQTLGTVGVVRDRFHEHLPFEIPSADLEAAGIFEGTLQGLRAGVAFNNSREFGYSVSPENGVLASLDYENLSESLGSDADREQLRADVRGYLAIPYRRSPLGRHALAARVAAGVSDGDFMLQRDFRVGGSDFGGLLRLDSTRFPVRGFDSSELRGQNAAIASIEYRFPIYQLERGPAVYPIYFHRILGDVFYDVGTAWNEDPVTLPGFQRGVSDAFDQKIASVGAEVAVDFFVGYFAPVRYRIGAAYLIDSVSGDEGKFRGYLSVGSSF